MFLGDSPGEMARGWLVPKGGRLRCGFREALRACAADSILNLGTGCVEVVCPCVCVYIHADVPVSVVSAHACD